MKKYNQTAAIRTQTKRSDHREHSNPIFMTSSFVFDSQEHARDLFESNTEGNIYSRYSNPNQQEFIDKLKILEGGEDGLPTASGMSAVFLTMISLLKKGDHLVLSSAVFGSIYQIVTKILPGFGIDFTLVDSNHVKEWEKATKVNTKMLFLETPSNPGLILFDIEALADLAKASGAVLVVDNCFATPYLQNPIEFGADIVIHSATKFIDGQGRTLGGAVIGKKKLIDEMVFFSRHTGPSISPFNAWILSKSLETLAIRMKAHCENALYLAENLRGHRKLEKVIYPGLSDFPQRNLVEKQMRLGGALVSIVLKDGLEKAMKFCNKIELISRSSNLGDSRSIATHSVTTTHSKVPPELREKSGIFDGTVRISVGLEEKNDILSDILQALNRI